MKLTQKQAAFTRLTFETNEPARSYLQIYKCKSKGVASACATRLLKNAKIKTYLQELNQKAEDDSIAAPKERKQRLTVFVREDNYTKFGISRQGNIQAIAELNKMEKIYTDNVVNVDNRTLNIIVNSEKAKELTQKLIDGERTE